MIEQLIKDQCERNRKEWYDSQFNTFGVETKEEELKNLDQITQQTAEAVLSAVREMVEWMRADEERVQQWISKGGVDYIDNKAKLEILNKLLTQLQTNQDTL